MKEKDGPPEMGALADELHAEKDSTFEAPGVLLDATADDQRGRVVVPDDSDEDAPTVPLD